MSHTVSPNQLRERLQQLGHRLAQEPGALALLALGSCGRDSGRLDRYSDLDFFVIAAATAVDGLVARPDWLRVGPPLVLLHRNTPDGWKALWADGVLAECAVFAPSRLATIAFSPGRVVWQAPGFDASALPAGQEPDRRDPVWHAREAVSCLYVGLGRWWRGERAAAHQLVAGDAVDQILLACLPAPDDRFNPRRRLEQRMVPVPLTGADLHLSLPQLAARILDLACAVLGPEGAAVAGLVRARLAAPQLDG